MTGLEIAKVLELQLHGLLIGYRKLRSEASYYVVTSRQQS
jgi:hypothetical protein